MKNKSSVITHNFIVYYDSHIKMIYYMHCRLFAILTKKVLRFLLKEFNLLANKTKKNSFLFPRAYYYTIFSHNYKLQVLMHAAI